MIQRCNNGLRDTDRLDNAIASPPRFHLMARSVIRCIRDNIESPGLWGGRFSRSGPRKKDLASGNHVRRNLRRRGGGGQSRRGKRIS